MAQARGRLDFGNGWLQTADAQGTFCQGHEAADPEELPRFASGLMAAARYSIASETGDFALEVEAVGILGVSEAFMKLGIESWEDLDYVRDSELAAEGVRLVQRRRLREARCRRNGVFRAAGSFCSGASRCTCV